MYLTNPSMRTALFSPIEPNDDAMGDLAETGIFSQFFHSEREPLFYARWREGEVDIVNPDARWAVEVKWSDKAFERHGSLKSVIEFCRQNDLDEVTITTRTASGIKSVAGITMSFVPCSIYCYVVGQTVISSPKRMKRLFGSGEKRAPSQVD